MTRHTATAKMVKQTAAPKFLAEKVERWPIAKLRANKRNAKKHPESQVEQIAKAIETWGWTMPIVVAENGQIQAGEGRWRAAKHLGMTEVPVLVARGWDAAKLRAYVLADNKLAENATWDSDPLGIELKELGLAGFDLALTGFSEMQIQRLLPRSDRAEGNGAELASQ